MQIDRGTDPMDMPESSNSSPTTETGESSRNYLATQASAWILRNMLNYSAQANNTSLERLQRYQRLLMARSEQEEIGTALQILREALNATAENNTACLTRLQKLRERLQAHTNTLFSHTNNRNSELQVLRNALNDEIEALNNMEVQLTNTSSRIEMLRDELGTNGVLGRNQPLRSFSSQLNYLQSISAMLPRNDAPSSSTRSDESSSAREETNRESRDQENRNSESRDQENRAQEIRDQQSRTSLRDTFKFLRLATASQDNLSGSTPRESSSSRAETTTREGSNRPNPSPNRNRTQSGPRTNRRRIEDTDTDEEPPRRRRRREGSHIWYPHYNANTRSWIEIHGKNFLYFKQKVVNFVVCINISHSILQKPLNTSTY